MSYKLKNIEIIVEILKQNNINQVVISPGGTNIPFIRMIQDDPFFECYSVVDERSALYFAIGIYLQVRKPVVMSCTSAQATRNYIPGLTEAFYKRVPILAITMSKHPRFTYQEYMQAPDQTSLPVDSIKKSFMLPYISDENDIYHAIRVVNQAILELTQNGYGPVQLCVPWLDFPIDAIEPKMRTVKRYSFGDDFDFFLDEKKIMIIIGEHLKFSELEKKEIEKFSYLHNAFIYVNHLSNFNCQYSLHANIVFTALTFNEFYKDYRPDVVISIGGQTGDYPLYKMLAHTEMKELEHWRVNEDGEVIDTYDKLTKVFKMKEITFFQCMNKLALEKDGNKVNHDYFLKWKKALDDIKYDKQLPFSNTSIACELTQSIPSKSIVQFSILNSLRVWNLYQFKNDVECYSNVGAFGIDGGMSTLIGQSIVSNQLCFMVVGDLAFFYDMNSLGIRHIKNNLRILLINNNGGIEFKLDNSENEYIDRYIAAANHFKNAEGWAKTCGFEYLSSKNIDEFKQIEKIFISASEKPILLEAFIKDSDEAIAYKRIIEQNRDQSVQTSMKKVVKKVLGDEITQKIKELMKR